MISILANEKEKHEMKKKTVILQGQDMYKIYILQFVNIQTELHNYYASKKRKKFKNKSKTVISTSRM